jgi:short-subunit dehydrogenase involved in D-alanine esterification of teichoic acids
MKLSKKTILITGGSSGIRFEHAKPLLQRDNTMIVTGRPTPACLWPKGYPA